MKAITLILLALLTSCNITMSMANTEGESTDAIDAAPSNDIKPSTSIEIPLGSF